MGNPAGVRRDFDALKERRFQAIRLLDQGLYQSEVARRLKVVRQTVTSTVKLRGAIVQEVAGSPGTSAPTCGLRVLTRTGRCE